MTTRHGKKISIDIIVRQVRETASHTALAL